MAFADGFIHPPDDIGVFGKITVEQPRIFAFGVAVIDIVKVACRAALIADSFGRATETSNVPGILVKRSGAFDPSVDVQTGVKTKSIMVIPLATPDGEFGALTAINSATSDGFVARDLERYSEFAEQIAARLSSFGFGMKDVGPVR